MGGISTHVLDLALGKPAAGVTVTLFRLAGGDWLQVGHGSTDEDGRVAALVGDSFGSGVYRIVFDTGGYGNPFYPEATVTFRVDDPEQHHHIPLLLAPHGYSTYRGS